MVTPMVIGVIQGAQGTFNWRLAAVFLIPVLFLCAVALSWSPGARKWFRQAKTSRSQYGPPAGNQPGQ
jgi:hypothetical protein